MIRASECLPSSDNLSAQGPCLGIPPHCSNLLARFILLAKVSGSEAPNECVDASSASGSACPASVLFVAQHHGVVLLILSIWRWSRPNIFTHFVNVPHNTSPTSSSLPRCFSLGARLCWVLSVDICSSRHLATVSSSSSLCTGSASA